MAAQPTVVPNTVNQLNGVCVELHEEGKTHSQEETKTLLGASGKLRNLY